MSQSLEEDLNVPKCGIGEFFEEIEGQLSLITGLVPYDSSITLQDIRRPCLVIGKPGIGKTCGIISIINKLNSILPPEKQLGFKKILLGQTIVGELSGIPTVNPTTGEVVRVKMPDLPSLERGDSEYGVLFLDEITTADEMQIQPALGLTDDSRSIGDYTLPEHWLVVAAGNGPDCTNFKRLDDMTISRFTVFDISYSYKKDWRPWAHENGVNENIIAFLNFAPDYCVRVESTDMDEAGKQFPCPRTWERLSKDLLIAKAMGRNITPAAMVGYAGRKVGTRAAREFSAFLEFRKTLNYSAEKILNGTEVDPEVMPKQQMHIILESCLKNVKQIVAETKDENGNFPLKTYQTVANMLRWFLKMTELENKLNVFMEIRCDLPDVASIILDSDFAEICPEFDDFMQENSALINSTYDDILSYNY